MNKIIPYNENIENGNISAFIKPTGEFIYNYYNTHIELAQNICRGEDYHYLFDIKHCQNDSYLLETFEKYKKKFNYNGERKDLDEFASSNLTKEELQLYKKWFDINEFNSFDIDSDFLVLLLRYDKVETITKKCITTTSKYPHIRFFNYYLMDWNIKTINHMYYNEQTNSFEQYHDKDWFLHSLKDKQIEEEIENIKRKVLKKDRPLFFK